MSASLAGAVKAYLEAQALGVPIFRDQAPRGQSYPYVTIQEGIGIVEETSANAFSGDNRVRELVQIDLWMQRHSPATNAVTESYSLPDALCRAINGCRLDAAPMKVYGMKLIGRTRLFGTTRATAKGQATPVEPSGTIHHVITAEVRRQL